MTVGLIAARIAPNAAIKAMATDLLDQASFDSPVPCDQFAVSSPQVPNYCAAIQNCGQED